MDAKAIIGRRCRYIGERHTGARGWEGEIIAVHRDGEILEDDRVIGALREDDQLEWRPFIKEKNGRERASFVSYDASPDQLEQLG